METRSMKRCTRENNTEHKRYGALVRPGKYMFLLFGGMLLLLLHGCAEQRDSVSVTTHPDGWSATESVDFHGRVVLAQGLSKESCQSCHGEDYAGGTSGISCYSSGCHAVFPHPGGFAAAGAESHALYIEEMLQWDISSCRSCHGSDYAGEGVAAKNCLSCHTAEDGPENCSTCHGSGANAAPPSDLAGNTATSSIGVGVHQAHVAGDTWTLAMQGQCRTCHLSPAAYASQGHIDDTPHAEVNFGALAISGGARPAWNRSAASCSDSYCHGNFTFRREDSEYTWAYTDEVMTGNNRTVFWQYAETGQGLCGTCHGLPPVGHVAKEPSECYTCHGDVVDENLNIVNKFLHINGEINVFGTLTGKLAGKLERSAD